MARPRKAEDEVEVLDAPHMDEPEVSSFDAALKKSKIVKIDKVFPPKIRNMSGMVYAGKKMEDFFPEKTIKHADFTDADLRGADFTGFNLQGSIFRRTKFEGAIFRNADCRWATFENVPDVKQADWTGADLRECVR